METIITEKPILILILLLVLTCSPVFGATIKFVDSAYSEENFLNVTNQDGDDVAGLTDGQTATLDPGKAYFMKLNPRGIFDFASEDISHFTTFTFVGAFFSNPENLRGIFALIFVVFLIFWRVKR